VCTANSHITLSVPRRSEPPGLTEQCSSVTMSRASVNAKRKQKIMFRFYLERDKTVVLLHRVCFRRLNAAQQPLLITILERHRSHGRRAASAPSQEENDEKPEGEQSGEN
jgi:hypothetical protein